MEIFDSLTTKMTDLNLKTKDTELFQKMLQEKLAEVREELEDYTKMEHLEIFVKNIVAIAESQPHISEDQKEILRYNYLKFQEILYS